MLRTRWVVVAADHPHVAVDELDGQPRPSSRTAKL
jgi:hypothetical protein